MSIDGAWKICAGDPTCVSFPGVAKPAKMGSADRAKLAVRSANSFGDMLAFLRFIRDHGADEKYARAELVERAEQQLARCLKTPTTADPQS